MQFGLFMMPLHPPHRPFADAYERDIAQIVLADTLGIREAWVGEHLTERAPVDGKRRAARGALAVTFGQRPPGGQPWHA
jgi:hypothetical protein